MKIAIILGTRPEIIKMSLVVKRCMEKQIRFFILHTNQHYAKNLDEIFFQELNLPKPKYNLSVVSRTHAGQVGKMLVGIEKILIREKPSIILIEGDTNTVLAGALAASKTNIRIGHIEAGLRSYDRNMPEEINRIVVDHLSDYLFAPTKKAKENLIKEGISNKKIFVTGNTIVDAICKNLKIAKTQIDILEKLGLKKNNYFLVTFHRQENVDEKIKLKSILSGLKLVYKEFKQPIIYPIHPRSQKRIKQFRLKIPKGLEIISPLSFLEYLQLEKNARLILTDSGGVQEEACILRVPCVTLRDNTERPETLIIGSNKLAGVSSEAILKAVKIMVEKRNRWLNPFGNGKASIKILNILEKNL